MAYHIHRLNKSCRLNASLGEDGRLQKLLRRRTRGIKSSDKKSILLEICSVYYAFQSSHAVVINRFILVGTVDEFPHHAWNWNIHMQDQDCCGTVSWTKQLKYTVETNKLTGQVDIWMLPLLIPNGSLPPLKMGPWTGEETQLSRQPPEDGDLPSCC